MARLLNISEAASLSLHTAATLAANFGQRLSNREIAKEIKVSEAHLAKVMQRLVQVGLVDSRRGPGGGFALTDKGVDSTLLDFFVALVSEPVMHNCLFDKPVCQGNCILGDLISQVDNMVIGRLKQTKVAELIKNKPNMGLQA